MRIVLLSAVLIIGGCGLIYGQNDDIYTVKGRVIDDKGNPFPHAGVRVAPVKYNTVAFDNISMDFIETDSRGAFQIKEYKNEFTKGKRFFLFVLAGDASDALITISPPFVWIRRYDKAFNGKLIRFGFKSVIDVGDVKVQFWFGRANLEFSKFKLKRRLSKIDWDGLYLRIRNRNGFRIYEKSLSQDDIYVKKYIDNTKSVLKISLPEGRWKVETIWNDKVLGQSSYFIIHRGKDGVNVSILPKQPRSAKH